MTDAVAPGAQLWWRRILDHLKRVLVREAETPGGRALRSSEVLFLELLQVAERRRWSHYARQLLVQRAYQHAQVLDRALVSAHREGSLAMAGELGALETAHRQAAVAAADVATRMARIAPSDPVDFGLLSTQARTLLDQFHASVSTIAEIERARLDHSIEVRHRRFVLSGKGEETGSSAADVALQAVQADSNPAPLHPHALAGLALSGGGIRSASFALGAMQSMSRAALLPAFEYFSSVSGGGYAASWFAAWSYRHREGVHGVDSELFRSLHSDCGPLHWVRRHSSYLAPRPHFTSGDLWALLVAYISNWLPVLLLITITTLTIMMVPFAISLVAATIEESARKAAQYGSLAFAFAFLVVYMGIVRRLTLYYREPGRIPRHPVGLAHAVFWGAAGLTVVLSATMPVGAVLLQEHGWRIVAGWPFAARSVFEPMATIFLAWLAACVLSWPVAKILTLGLVQRSLDALRSTVTEKMVSGGPLKRNKAPAAHVLLAMVVGSLVASALLAALLPLFRSLVPRPWLMVVVGPAILMVAMAVSELVALLFVARFQREVDRAWASRVGAWMLAGVVAWTALGLVSLGGHAIWVDGELRQFRWALMACVAVPVMAGAYFWTLRSLGGRGASVVALWLTALIAVTQFATSFLGAGLQQAGAQWYTLTGGLLLTFGLLYALSQLIDVNRFSLHSIYKEGLVRTFLGASRLEARNPHVQQPDGPVSEHESRQFTSRRPDPVTNTDDDDSPLLAWLRSRGDRELPVLLLNSAVNGSSDTDQEGRYPRQWPFTFSQYFCGSPAEGVGYKDTQLLFKDSDRGGITLGEAMAVSGAAMSPTSGYKTHVLKAFLYGFLNARLGLWVGNPRFGSVVERSRPTIGGLTILREMLGHRAVFGKWIHLSDGGHFENLGVYELLRRGCLRIVVVDGSCDPDREFGDLANTIRRARIDLAVQISHSGAWNLFGPEGGPSASRLEDARAGRRERQAGAQAWTWFDIDYGKGLPRGKLLYIKPSVYKGQPLPVEVQNYWKEQPSFPHESTADQFFSERQLEAYRALGELCTLDAMRVLGIAAAATSKTRIPVDTEFMRMVKRSLPTKSGKS